MARRWHPDVDADRRDRREREYEGPEAEELAELEVPETMVADCVRCGAPVRVPVDQWDGEPVGCRDCFGVDEDDERGGRR